MFYGRGRVTDPGPHAIALLRDLDRLDRNPADAPERSDIAARIERLQAPPDAWADWLEHHQLGGYCLALLQDTRLDSALLPAARERLALAHRRQVRRNERLLALLLALKARLDEAGIPFLLIKGFAVSVRFAGGLDRRLMWDQDILIRPRDLGPVMAAAESFGLRAQAGTGFNPERLTRVLHAIELKDLKRKLDVHWVFRNRAGMRRGYDAAATNAQLLQLGDAQLLAISDLDLLAMSCLSLLNDMERSNVRLRKVWDVYLMVKQLDATTDWTAWLDHPDLVPLRRTLLNVMAFCLALAACDEDCPQLRGQLDGQRDVLLMADRGRAECFMRRHRQSLINRGLMARLQPVPAIHYWAWWLGTLPLRIWHGRKL